MLFEKGCLERIFLELQVQEKKTVAIKNAVLLLSDLFQPSVSQLYGIVLFSALLILALLFSTT